MRVLSLLLMSLSLCGCRTDVHQAPATAPTTHTTTSPAPSSTSVTYSKRPAATTLSIVHISDTEASLLPDDAAADGGGVARAVTLVHSLAAEDENVVVVHGGDTLIPAPETSLEIDGVSAVVRANNLYGVAAAALGNHEFDLGEAFLADVIQREAFPYLSATLRVHDGPLKPLVVDDGATHEAATLAGKIAPRAKVCARAKVDGVCPLWVGITATTPETLRALSAGASSSLQQPDSPAATLALLQAQVDRLRDEGIRIIVVLSHLQDAAREVALVNDGLVGVDVIVSGGGENRLASKRHRLLPGDAPDALCTAWGEPCYPLALQAHDGDAVLVVAAGGDARYLGRVRAFFDDVGALTGYDDAASRPWPVDEVSLLERKVSVENDALLFQQRVRKDLAPLLHEVAHVGVYLEGTREAVRNRETNLGDLSADALLYAARGATPTKESGSDDVSIPVIAMRNGGGIRASIGAVDEKTGAHRGGPIREIDLRTAFRFNSDLVFVRSTHAELVATLESALRGAGTSRGHFPQVSSEIELEYSLTAPEQTHIVKDGTITAIACPGQRVRRLVIRGGGAAVVVVDDGVVLHPSKRIDIVTLGYLAKNGDGWFPARKPSFVPLAGTEQSAIVAFIRDLQRRGTWHDGSAYVDPADGKGPRIRATRDAVASTCTAALGPTP